MEHYRQRRKQLMERMGDGVAIIYGAVTSHGSPLQAQQNQDFYYLTGLEEMDSILVLAPNHEETFVLFVPPKDPVKETWMGKMLGVDGAREFTGADAVYPRKEYEKKAKEYLRHQDRLYYTFDNNSKQDRQIGKLLRELRAERRQGVTEPYEFVSVDRIIHEMRVIKDDEEIRRLKRAGAITANGHKAAMEACRPGMWEYELQAVLEYEFRRGGSYINSFHPIVAGGEGALILHYETNCEKLVDGDLVLVDAGAKYNYYAADITRTYPVNGKFTEAQRRIYELVLKAEKEVIAMVKPGVEYQEMHERAVRVIVEGLVDLGILSGDIDDLMKEKEGEDGKKEPAAYKRFFMHKTNHWMGIDCHDVGLYRRRDDWKKLVPGMVFTVEPGLYIPRAEDIPEPYRGIAVRIEDDVVVTEEGGMVITDGVPKEVDEIEAAMTENWDPQRRLNFA